MKELIRIIRWRFLQLWFRFFASTLNLNGCILLLAPHPDDEVIGCGGLLTRLVKQGKDVRVVVLSNGAESHHECCDTPKEEIVVARRGLTFEAVKVIGLPLNKVYSLNFPDGSINARHAETERLKALIAEIKPDVILVPHSGEGWNDHLATREIGLHFAPNGVSVYEYCVWFWFYNSWNIAWNKASVVKMTKEEHETKLKAIDAYTLPTALCGKPWSGVLPHVFLKANKSKTEVYFKVK